MESRKIIAVDCGIMNLKAKCGAEEKIYQNNYSIGNTDEFLIGKNTYNVTFKDKQLTLGQNAENSFAGEGKESEMHMISTLTACTHFLDPEDTNENIYLMYGESVARYYNASQRDDIISKLEGKHTITVDGKQYRFNIEHVHILPEGIGYVLNNLEDYLGVQYIVDIGGGTINILVVMNGRPVKEESVSFALGIHNIKAKVLKALNELGIGEFKENLVDQYLKHGVSNLEVQKVIEKTIIEQLALLDRKLLDLGMNLHNILKVHNVTFVGGGSDLLKTHIEKYYKGAFVVDDAVMANVRGFHTYGMAKFGQLPKATTKTTKEKK
ncbi:ParM/StbA family protein [Clostridium perfringens]